MFTGPPPLYTVTNRTPRSTSRRASNNRVPKSAVRLSSRPYIALVSLVSLVKSTASGACVCILYASSYVEIRDSKSESPFSRFNSLSFRTRSNVRWFCSGVTPGCGFKFKIGDVPFRNSVP